MSEESLKVHLSLLTIPVDVLEQHIILALLSWSDLIACQLVCQRLRKLASRVLASRKKTQEVRSKEGKLFLDLPKHRQQQVVILKSMFEEGVPIESMQWFQQYLRYPVFFSSTNKRPTRKQQQQQYQKQKLLFVECVILAAKGTYYCLILSCRYY